MLNHLLQHRSWLSRIKLIAISAIVSMAPASAQDEWAGKFLEHCGSCHSVGEGELAGPDLLASTAWPTESLAGAVKTMEDNVGALSEAEVQGYTQLLKSPDVRERLAAERKRAEAQQAATLEPASALEGQALYFGARALVGGGPACVACHQAGGEGGTFGPPLTPVRLDRIALTSGIEKANYPVMRGAYKDHPIGRQEAAHLAAYLQSISPSAAPASPGAVGVLAAGALLIPAGVMGALLALLRSRSTTVRSRLVRKARR